MPVYDVIKTVGPEWQGKLCGDKTAILMMAMGAPALVIPRAEWPEGWGAEMRIAGDKKNRFSDWTRFRGVSYHFEVT